MTTDGRAGVADWRQYHEAGTAVVRGWAESNGKALALGILIAKAIANEVAAAREAALREERTRAAELVRSCKPPVVDWTTQLVRQQLEAIAECIQEPPPTKGPPDGK